MRDILKEAATIARQLPNRPALGAVTGVFGVVATIAGLAFGSPMAAAIVIAAFVLVGGAFWLYGAVLRDRVGGLFEVIDEIQEWAIDDWDGTQAQMTRTRSARVLQDGVFAIREFAWGTNRHERPWCEPWTVVHEYEDDQGRDVALIALEDVKGRDDRISYKVGWHLKDVFVDTDNWAETVVLHETVSLTMRVIFPLNRPPVRANFIPPQKPDRPENLHIRGRDDGRHMIEKTLWYPKAHRTYKLTWQWHSTPRQSHG